MIPITPEARAKKLFVALERLAVAADREWRQAADESSRAELKQEIGMYLSLMTPLAVVLDLHLPTDCRGASAPDDAYSFLLTLLGD